MSTTNPILEGKDPSDVKDYSIDWSQVLAAEGETSIANSVWFQSNPLGLDVVDVGSPVLPVGSPPAYPGEIIDLVTVIWVSGGTPGTYYEMTNQILTGGVRPRIHERTIKIPCVQR